MYEKSCSRCGYTWRQFHRTGLLGCPHCYVEFEAELLPTLKKLQKSTVHKGNAPKISSEDKELFARYSKLMEEKELAGISRDFTRMADIAVELNTIIEELKERGIL